MPRKRNDALTVSSRMMIAWVLGGVVLGPMVGFAGAASSIDPYHEIAARNVFGLRPPPARVEPPPAPLPQVVLTGITTILGNKRALLKIRFPAQPSRPAKEESCILTEGQRDGPVEVLAINEKTAQVKLDNSGTVCVITFEKLPPTPPPAARPRLPPSPYWPRPVVQTTFRKY